MEEILYDRIHNEEKSYTSDRSSRMSDERNTWCKSESNIDNEECTYLTCSWISDRIEYDPEIREYRHTKSTDTDSIGLRREKIEGEDGYDHRREEKYHEIGTSKKSLKCWSR
jgi:hypothetical protein